MIRLFPRFLGLFSASGLLRVGPEKRRLAREGGWVVVGNAIKALSMVLGVRLLTEVMPRDVFGVVNLVLGGVMLAFNVLAYPLLQGVTRLYPDADSEGTVHALRRLILKVLLGVTVLVALGMGIWLLTSASREFLRGSPVLVYLALVCLLVLQSFMAVDVAMLRAARRQKAASLWEACNAGLRPLATAGLVLLLGAETHVALGAYALVLGGTTAASWALRKPWPPDRVHASTDDTVKRLRRQIVSYGLPLVPMLAMSWVLTVSDRYIIAWEAGAGAAGLYTAAYGLITTPFIMSQGIFSTTLRPVFFRAISEKNRALERRTYVVWVASTASICLVGAMLTLVLAPWVARVFLAAEYRAASAFMPWLALGASLQALSQTVEALLYGHKRTALLPVGYACTAASCLLVTFALVRSHGVMGAAWAYCLTYGLHLVLFSAISCVVLRWRSDEQAT